jgi:hypothetical protein
MSPLCKVGQYQYATSEAPGQTYQLHLSCEIFILFRLEQHLKHFVILERLVRILTIQASQIIARDWIDELVPHVSADLVILV